METMSVWSVLLLMCMTYISLSTADEPMLAVPCSLSDMDTDNDGYLYKNEVDIYFLNHMPDDVQHPRLVAVKRVERFFEEFDFNDDDRVQIEEMYLEEIYQDDCIIKFLLQKNFED